MCPSARLTAHKAQISGGLALSFYPLSTSSKNPFWCYQKMAEKEYYIYGFFSVTVTSKCLIFSA